MSSKLVNREVRLSVRRRKQRDLLFVGLLLILLVSLVYQGYRMMWPHTEGENAERMLFEVAQFQMQVLGTSLADAAGSSRTDELNALKLAAYSASYAHDRLAKTFGDGAVDPLKPVGDLVNVITEWQIGGDRLLTDAEKDMLLRYSQLYAGVMPVYEKLLSEDGHVIASQAGQLKKIGKELAKTLEETQ